MCVGRLECQPESRQDPQNRSRTTTSYLKDEIFNMARAWDKEKSESPTGIEPMTSRTPGGALSTELRELTESKVILLSSYATGVLHTARISKPNSLCTTPVTYELSKMTLFSVSSRSSVDRAPARCPGGHGFDSCRRGLRFFFVPRSCHVEYFIFHI